MKSKNAEYENVVLHRRQNRRARIAFFLAAVFCVFFGVENLFAQEFQTVANGIEYAKMTRRMKSADGKDENVVFNFLRLDLTRVRLDVVHAFDAAVGLEKTSSIATRHGAAAAINAGFFRLDKSAFAGDAAGILQIDGKLLSEANGDRIALLINDKAYDCTSCAPEKRTVVSFERLKSRADFYSGDEELKILGINREIKEQDSVLFTPQFGKTTPASDRKVLEIVVDKKKIKLITESNGGAKIPRKGYVIALGGKSKDGISAKIKAGKKASVVTETYADKIPAPEAMSAIEFRNADDIVGGVPQLIKNGKIDITWQEEKISKAFVETHHPRTAIAKLKDGKFLMVAVDGRSEESGGVSLPDLAALLLELGATDAINLDGGGSTTMFLNGKIVNKPSDKEGERPVSDAILVFPRGKHGK